MDTNSVYNGKCAALQTKKYDNFITQQNVKFQVKREESYIWQDRKTLRNV